MLLYKDVFTGWCSPPILVADIPKQMTRCARLLSPSKFCSMASFSKLRARYVEDCVFFHVVEDYDLANSQNPFEMQLVTVGEGDYGIASNDEDLDDSSRSVIDVVDIFQLQETSFDKSSYLKLLKGFMKKMKGYLEEHNPERVDSFQTSAQSVVKKEILGKFKEFCFYTGSSMDDEGQIVLCFYSEDGMTPYFWFFKDGLLEEKC